MCIYIYTNEYAYMYIHVNTHICIYIYVHIYIYTSGISDRSNAEVSFRDHEGRVRHGVEGLAARLSCGSGMKRRSGSGELTTIPN